MNDRHLHIIALNIPWPANYGGVIDIYCKAKALSEAGVKVHLHCFEYGRSRADENLQFCHQVHYYHRETSFGKHLTCQPYIVSSRKSKELMDNLLRDDYPILCEGLHTTFLLNDERFSNRKVFVRAHNVEHDYYRGLAKSESVFWKKMYFSFEAAKLKHYEPVLRKSQGIFAISQQDYDYFSNRYTNVKYLPAFNSYYDVTSLFGKGNYVLYHGNLSVRENVDAALWLIENVFSKIKEPSIIAGLCPDSALLKAARKYDHISVYADVSDEEMAELLRNAQVNVLITHQPTGLKLKLLNALGQGRFCVVNSQMLAGTSLESMCSVCDDASLMISEIEHLFIQEFTMEDVEKRRNVLSKLYDNTANVQILIQSVFQK